MKKANNTDTVSPFLDLHLSIIAHGFVSSKIYDKRDDFDFDIVNFPFRKATFLAMLLMAYTFRNLLDLLESVIMSRNKCLTAKLLQLGYRYHKLQKTFSKFYRRHFDLISKFNVGLKTLLREGLSEPEFYGDLVYKFKKLIGRNDFFFNSEKSLRVTDV